MLPIIASRMLNNQQSSGRSRSARESERIERPDDIIPAIRRGIVATEAGKPALLEFITARETAKSSFT
jgi:hypothetical protein